MTDPRSLRPGRQTDNLIGWLVIILVVAVLFGCAAIGSARLDDTRPPVVEVDR